MAFFLFLPTEDIPIRAHDLLSLENTRKALRLVNYDDSCNSWREGYYTPRGKIVCKTVRGDELTAKQCKNIIKAKFLTYVDFINFCFEQIGDTYEGSLNLNALTSLEGIKFPKTLRGNLLLSKLKSSKNVTFPKRIEGDLWLSGLKSAKDLILPEYVGGFLGLNGLRSKEGLKLPKFVGRNIWMWRISP